MSVAPGAWGGGRVRPTLTLALVLLAGCEPSYRDGEIILADSGAGLPGDARLGVDLEVLLALRYRTPGPGYDLPEGVVVLSDDSGAVEVEILGPRDGAVEVVLIPRRTGVNRLRILADDNDDVAEIVYRAEDPTTATLETFVEGGAPSRASSISMFTSSSVLYAVEFFAAGEPVIGRSPLSVTPSGAATVERDAIHAGSLPAAFTLGTAVLDARLDVTVVDVTAIADVRVTGAGRLDGLLQGDNAYVTADPLDSTGVEITGRPRPNRTVTVEGTAALLIAAPDPELIGINGFEPGSASLRVQWGEAATTVPISVRAR
jgi:hypothetical protein